MRNARQEQEVDKELAGLDLDYGAVDLYTHCHNTNPSGVPIDADIRRMLLLTMFTYAASRTARPHPKPVMLTDVRSGTT